MSQKRQKRIKETVAEFEKDVDTAISNVKLVSKTDSELFAVDRTGSKSARKRIVQDITPMEAGEFISKTEKHLIRKTQSTGRKVEYGKHKLNGGKEHLRDLWEVSGDIVTVKNNVTSSSSAKKTKVALPGQSYNPTVDDHQNALAEALALEIKKNEKLEQQRTDNITGVHNTDANDLFIMNESDDEESADDADEETQYDEDGQAIVSDVKVNRKKQQVKLTRAQRNRIKTRNAATFEQHKEKGVKVISKLIDALPVIMRTIEDEEQQAITRKLLKENRKKLAEEEKSLSTLTYEEAAAVPLTDELTGSLRTIIPKGVAVLDRTLHMRQNGDLSARDRRKRKAYEKPHGDKNVVWVPKYKAAAR